MIKAKSMIKAKMSEILYVRVRPSEKALIKALAANYAGGNISQWVVYASLNAPRQYLVTKSKQREKRI